MFRFTQIPCVMKLRNIIIWIILGMLCVPVFPQTAYEVASKDVTIEGTSTLHDWVSVVEETTGTASLTIKGNKLKGIEALNLAFPSTSIKSGKEQMDEKTYRALKTDEHEAITFALTEVLSISPENGGYLIRAKGELFIAGVTQLIEMEVTGTVENGQLMVEGEYPIDMTTFDIEPPTAVFGTIKTGKDLNIVFKLGFVPAGTAAEG